VASATIGVIAQRLLRRICGDCKTVIKPERTALEYLGLLDKNQEHMAESTVQYYRLKLDSDGWPIFYKGRGCEACNNTGYKNRIGVYEVMRMNDEIRELAAKGSTTAMIRFAAKQSGMVPLKDYSIRLVAQGLSTTEEVVRVTLADTAGEDKICPRCRNPIGDDFVKCPFCQHELKTSCSRCGTLQQEGWASCPKCGITKEDANMESICSCCQAEVSGEWSTCRYCMTPRKYDTMITS
jgi:type IV pilus assembly protein PilB